MAKTTTKIKETNWEKAGVYLAAGIAFLTILFYVVDMKVDIGKLQVEIQHLKEVERK